MSSTAPAISWLFEGFVSCSVLLEAFCCLSEGGTNVVHLVPSGGSRDNWRWTRVGGRNERICRESGIDCRGDGEVEWSEDSIAKMRLNRGCCVCIQLEMQSSDRLVVGFTNDWLNSGKRKAFDHRIDERYRFVGWGGGEIVLVASGWWRWARPSVVAVVGKSSND